MRINMKNFSLLVITFFLSTIAIFAQDTTGRIVGSVSAPDGAVPGATVVVTDNQTGKQQTVTTSSDGTFTVSQLEFGNYTVRVTAQGFKAFNANEVKIDAGREYPLNVTLEVGEITQEVTITAGAETVNATNAELSTTVSKQQIRELPLNGRNPLALLNLQAGANPTTSSINGQRSSATAVTRDGLNVQDNFIRTNTFVSDQPSVDDTGEFTVTTQNAGAEQGGGASLVQLVTPRGGSKFSGNLYAFNRNSKFTANSFFNNASNLPKPFLNRNQFGGSLSGPVPLPAFGEGGPTFLKNKGFFFFNYERFWLAQQATIRGLTTLLPAARNGNFTYLDTSGTQRTVNVLTGQGFVNPLTTAQGGVLSVDPVIQNRILSRLPNSGNGVMTGINFLQSIDLLRADPRIRNSYTSRFDVDLNDRNSFNIVYRRNDDVDARTDQAAGFSNQAFVETTGPTDFFAVAYRTTIGSNFSNEIRGGIQDSGVIFNESNIPTDFLIGQGLVTSPEGSFRTQGRNTLYRNIQDNAVYTWGNHSLRFGGNVDFQETEAINLLGTTPVYNITTTTNPNTPGLIANQFPGTINTTDLARANALRYFLAGVVGGGSLTTYLNDAGAYSTSPSRFRLNYKILSGYISDQWRVGQNLTLNMGLRYEYYTPLNNPDLRYLEPVIPDVNNLKSITNPNGVLNYVGTNSGTPGNFFRGDKNNFGPNFSFAYSPKFEKGLLAGLTGGDTVIRGGFRIGYLNDEYLRAPDAFNQANAGLNQANSFATRAGSTDTNLRSTFSPAVNVAFEPIPGLVIPNFTAPPRTFRANNPTRLGSVFGVDPNYKVPKIYEYNFGIQREIGFKTVLELRYVGNRSDEMIRSIDFNQLDILSNGFLDDFRRAQQNCRLQATAPTTVGGVGVNPSTVFDPLFRCTDARFNSAIPGSQQTPIFNQLSSAGLLNNATIINLIQRGEPGALAQTYISNGLTGSVAFQPTNEIFNAELLTNGGTFRYNALQAEVRRRFAGGLYFQANYTFQKILGDVPDDSQLRQSPYQDNNNPRLQYGRPDYDRTHTFNANMIYELPFGKGKRFLNQGGIVDLVFGGFQFGSIVNLSSGPPLGVIDPRGTLARAGRSGRQSARTTLSTDEIKDLTGVFNTPNGIYFVNPKVLFALGSNGQRIDLNQPLPAGVSIVSVRAASPLGQAPFEGQVFFFNNAGEIGNLPRNFINGLPYLNWDASLSKNIRIRETMRLQLRMEAFNVLNNQVPFFGADLNVDSNNFGRVLSSYNAPRIVQFGARFDF